MADFPRDWDVHEDKDFATFSMDIPLEADMSVMTLLKLDKTGRSTGVYKIALAGGGVVDIPIPVTDILHEPPLSVANMVIKLSIRADKINIALNSTTSFWRDLLVLLRSSTASVTTISGDPIPSDTLIEYLDELSKTEKSTAGASIRFAVAGSEDSNLQLEIQSLPMQARYLTKAALKRDNSVSVLQGFFPLKADMFAGQNPGGPVPSFFAVERDAVYAQLLNNPDPIRDDIATLNACFIRMEHLTVDEAHRYLQGKARAAKGFQIFPPFTGPPLKRARLMPDSYNETGDLFP